MAKRKNLPAVVGEVALAPGARGFQHRDPAGDVAECDGASAHRQRTRFLASTMLDCQSAWGRQRCRPRWRRIELVEDRAQAADARRQRVTVSGDRGEFFGEGFGCVPLNMRRN
jgi:hypothetical protein